MRTKTSTTLSAAAIALLLAAMPVGGARADSAGAAFSNGKKFTETTGETLYANVCQACHMSNGQGATGAGTYPALANNEKLAAAGYPLYIVLHGQKGMPAVGTMMTDEQVAAVVDYVRTNFGNHYTDKIPLDDVKGSR